MATSSVVLPGSLFAVGLHRWTAPLGYCNVQAPLFYLVPSSPLGYTVGLLHWDVATYKLRCFTLYPFNSHPTPTLQPLPFQLLPLPSMLNGKRSAEEAIAHQFVKTCVSFWS